MEKPSGFDDFLRSDSYAAWNGKAQRDFAPDECQAYAMGLVLESVAARLFYTSVAAIDRYDSRMAMRGAA